MERQRENGVEKRRRKVIARPVLVRSVKTGGAVSAEYSKPSTASTSFWKAA